MNFGDAPSNLGLVAVGHKKWIAGAIYTQNLARALQLVQEDERGQLVLLRGPSSSDNITSMLRPDVERCLRYDWRGRSTTWHRVVRGGYALSRLRWPTSLEAQCRLGNVRAVFPMCSPWRGATDIASMTWIPDFQHCHYPEFFPPKTVEARNRIYQQLINCGGAVVVSSQDARRDLQRFFSADEGKVIALPFVSMASKEWYFGDPQAVARKYDLPERYLMFPSQFWVHKNHETLFRAVDLARHRGLNDVCVVCTGLTHDPRRPNHFARLQTLIRDLSLDRHIRVLGLLPRIDQIQLTRRAIAIVQPSLFEGWSAIIEDARTLGKHMMVSDLGVHREQDPPRCRFFNPKEPEEIATLLAFYWSELSAGPNLADESAAHAEHLRRGRQFARRFLEAVDVATGRGSIHPTATGQPEPMLTSASKS